MTNYNQKIVIAGAGISGLSAGFFLKKLGYHNITFIEASDRPGGRMKTEKIDGYSLDYGFHYLLTASPFANLILDYKHLNLKYIKQGALIMKRGKIKKIVDPFKNPILGLNMWFSSLWTWHDKKIIVKRRAELKLTNETSIFEKYEVKTASILRKKRFSNKIIKNFFEPFFSSIFMENELSTSRRVFDYHFKLMAEGEMALPALGIEQIPLQIASKLEKAIFIFNTKALEYKEKVVTLSNGQTIPADIFVIATEQNSLYSTLTKQPLKKDHRSATCLYFSADVKPFTEPMMCLNGNSPKLVSSVNVLTNISEAYAPPGKELIAVSLNGFEKPDNALLEREVKEELELEFGKNVYNWKLIKVYRIDYAIPNLDFVLGKRQIKELRVDKSTYVCGDHLLYGNLNAAVKSGKMVSEIIHKDFNKGLKGEKKKRYDNIFDDSDD